MKKKPVFRSMLVFVLTVICISLSVVVYAEDMEDAFQLNRVGTTYVKAALGEEATFTVEAVSEDQTTPITYQWYKGKFVYDPNSDRYLFSEEIIPGATSESVNVSAEYGDNKYYCAATQGSGRVESEFFTLKVPSNLTLNYRDRYSAQVGTKLTLKVDASTDCQPITYSWYTYDKNDDKIYINGADTNILDVTAQGTVRYYCRVADGAGTDETAEIKVIGTYYDTDNAQSIAVGETKTAVVTNAWPVYYKFIPEVSGDYQFISSEKLSRNYGNPLGELLDADKVMLAYNNDREFDENGKYDDSGRFEIVYKLEAGKTYYLMVNDEYDDTSMTCEFQVTVNLLKQDEKTTTDDKKTEESGAKDASKQEDKKSDTPKDKIDQTVTEAQNEKPGQTVTETQKDSSETVVKGKIYTVAKLKYKVMNPDMTGKGTVTVTGTTQKKGTLKKLTVPAKVMINGVSFKVTAIGNKAFTKCKKLKSVTIGKNVKTIGTSAFAGDTALTKVTIGKSVTKIGKSAFSGDKKLKNIIIKSAKLKSVGKNAIKGIQKKAQVKVPKKQLKKYKKLFKSKTGFKKTMKIKK